MAETKSCKQCGKEFAVTDTDLEYLDRISPTFNGVKCAIPAPSFCSECRNRRRVSFRNERCLYKRKCDLCQKEIISLYHPGSKFKVYCQECWWGDKWNQFEFAKDYDPSKSFHEQLKELQEKCPRLTLFNSRSENSEYSNHSAGNRNCYLIFASFDNENVMFSRKVRKATDCLDCDTCFDNSHGCYECVSVGSCYDLLYSQYCTNCSESYFLKDCIGCKNCYRCIGLRNKQYCFENKQLTKEEYETKLKGVNLGKRSVVDEEGEKFKSFYVDFPNLYAHLTNCEDCTGDDLIGCSNCKNCFDLEQESENCSNFENGEFMKYGVDVHGAGPAEFIYEVHGMLEGHYSAFCHACYYSTNVYCSDNCQNSRDIFGCVSLKKAQFCILNKQYSKEEYEALVPKIIEKMKADGEWGEFLPTSLSPFSYNETIAMEQFPLRKEEAEKIGATWLDQDFTPKYDGEAYEPKDDIKDYDEVSEEDERNKLLTGIIKCVVSGKPFKILPQELAFYIEKNIPLPNKHYEVRYRERRALRNSKKLYHRECMCEETGHDHEGRCKNEFETTYAPDRPEKVYCEDCYQRTVK